MTRSRTWRVGALLAAAALIGAACGGDDDDDGSFGVDGRRRHERRHASQRTGEHDAPVYDVVGLVEQRRRRCLVGRVGCRRRRRQGGGQGHASTPPRGSTRRTSSRRRSRTSTRTSRSTSSATSRRTSSRSSRPSARPGNGIADVYVSADTAWWATTAADGHIIPMTGPAFDDPAYDRAELVHDDTYFEVSAVVFGYGWNTDHVPDGLTAMDRRPRPRVRGQGRGRRAVAGGAGRLLEVPRGEVRRGVRHPARRSAPAHLPGRRPAARGARRRRGRRQHVLLADDRPDGDGRAGRVDDPGDGVGRPLLRRHRRLGPEPQRRPAARRLHGQPRRPGRERVQRVRRRAAGHPGHGRRDHGHPAGAELHARGGHGVPGRSGARSSSRDRRRTAPAAARRSFAWPRSLSRIALPALFTAALGLSRRHAAVADPGGRPGERRPRLPHRLRRLAFGETLRAHDPAGARLAGDRPGPRHRRWRGRRRSCRLAGASSARSRSCRSSCRRWPA